MWKKINLMVDFFAELSKKAKKQLKFKENNTECHQHVLALYSHNWHKLNVNALAYNGWITMGEVPICILFVSFSIPFGVAFPPFKKTDCFLSLPQFFLWKNGENVLKNAICTISKMHALFCTEKPLKYLKKKMPESTRTIFIHELWAREATFFLCK